ncbi:MAG: ribbon-helix-helix domain-containing protein [Candidatus Dormibacteraeota bacterium]|nr:ribbon-helix-helix domain-containing protein [Candidatus Dormibacteraeota bacterium]
MAATRTQVYLTEAQRRKIDQLIAREGHSLAWVVREALDQYLAGPTPDRQGALDATFGLLPDLAVPARGEWDRYPAGSRALVTAKPASPRARPSPRRPL